MAWFKIDDNFYDHPKVDELSLDAVGLWALCGAYAARHLTDGYVPKRRALRLGGEPQLIEELIQAELWDPVDGGWQFRNWEEYNPTREDVESKREADRKRKQRQRRNSEGKFESAQTKMSRRDTSRTSKGDSERNPSGAPSGIPEGVPAGIQNHVPDESQNEAPPADEPPPEPMDAEIIEEWPADAEPPESPEDQEPPLDIESKHENVPPESERNPDGIHPSVHPSRPDPARPDPYVKEPRDIASDAGDAEEQHPENDREDVIAILQAIDAHCEAHGFKTPNWTKTNRNAARLMIDRDGYSLDQIQWIIGWVSSHDFWPDKIRSAANLRKKFDQLKYQAQREYQTNPAVGGLNVNSQRARSTLELGAQLENALNEIPDWSH